MVKPDPRIPTPIIDDEPTTHPLPFRTSVTLMARSLAGIAQALHRIADILERDASS